MSGDTESGKNPGKVVRLSADLITRIESRGKFGQTPSDVIEEVFDELEKCKRDEH